MARKILFPVWLLTAVLTLSCHTSPAPKQPVQAQVKDTILTLPYDTLLDDRAAYISGMHNDRSGCLSRLDSMNSWKTYSEELDSLFYRIDKRRLSKMKTWAANEFQKDKETATLFYPFGGPDFLNANVFYPNADKYILIGLEPIGSFPDICNLPPDTVKSYLDYVSNSLADIYKRSYFITKTMITDLRKTKVRGTVPLISLFIKRTGHHISSIRKVIVDADGNCIVVNNYDTLKNVVQGVKVNFLSPDEMKLQSVYYFRTDISDKGFEKRPGFRKYLNNLPVSNTYLKAASYLMHFDEFKIIRDIVFDKSSTILQDDSGIAYKYFDKEKWDIKLYGNYTKPGKEFSYISEPDLEKAYKTSVMRPLPYRLGYNWRTEYSNMLYAVRKPK